MTSIPKHLFCIISFLEYRCVVRVDYYDFSLGEMISYSGIQGSRHSLNYIFVELNILCELRGGGGGDYPTVFLTTEV